MFTPYTVDTNRQAASPSQPRIEWSGYTRNNTKDILADLWGSVSTAFLFQTNTKRKYSACYPERPWREPWVTGTKVKGGLLGSWGCITSLLIHRATLMVNLRYSACWCWQCVSCHWDPSQGVQWMSGYTSDPSQSAPPMNSCCPHDLHDDTFSYVVHKNIKETLKAFKNLRRS